MNQTTSGPDSTLCPGTQANSGKSGCTSDSTVTIQQIEELTDQKLEAFKNDMKEMLKGIKPKSPSSASSSDNTASSSSDSDD